MATFLYNNARHLFATAGLDWLTCTPNLMLVSASYGALPADMTVADIPSDAILIRDIALTSLGETSGVCRGTCPQLDAFLAAEPAVAIVIYSKQGSDAASPLIYYSADGVGFPFTPEGFDYAIGYDQANGGWFQI